MNRITVRWALDAAVWAAGLVTALALIADATASEQRLAAPANADYRNECASCHIAYPPQLLPPASWKAITANLSKHFGTDATIDAAPLERIDAFLQANAGRDRRGASGSPPLRITETGWFRHEHDRVLARTATKQPSDCGACHPGAVNGDFDEHAARVAR